MFSFGLALVLLFGPPPPVAANPSSPPKPPTAQKKGEKTKVVREVVVVTAARLEQPLGEAVSLVTVVSGEELARSPALVLDDHLRGVPGFSLFRRSSSLVAHPTTQGVSLRGIGPSGASRTLVLFDGTPLNDPFGGWVYWNRVPLGTLERVEVVRGATSQLYGSSALAGAIQLLPRRPRADTLEARGQIGNRQTYDLELLAADRSGEWGYLVSGRLFDTDGFFLVDQSERGPVDVRARSEFQAFFGRAYYKNFHAGANVFSEGRGNGTRLQTNSTHLYLLEAGITEDSWQGNFYSQWGLFQNSFSRVLSDRSAEFLTARQRVSSIGQGSSFTWRPGRRFLLGADWRRVSWDRHEQNLVGAFAQDLIALRPRLDLLVGVRLDVWKSGRTRSVVNPRVGLLYRASDALTLRGSAYGGFRAPTLNELFRPFRVGNVRTLANPNLEEERLWGAELGADLHPSRSVLVRINGFWNSLRDPVSNLTLSVAPEGILRQR
ncbi:MAG: TonB-dependent receptor plug domain-containing protein, partial [Terriglobia bacterium]